MSENDLIFMFATNGAPDKSTHIRKELEILLLPLKVSDNFDETVLKCFQEIFFEKDTRIAASLVHLDIYFASETTKLWPTSEFKIFIR